MTSDKNTAPQKFDTRTFGRTSSRLNASILDKLAVRLKAFELQETDFAAFPEIELEVGMGNGLALFERAKAAPTRLFIGSEVYQNGLRSLINAIEKHNQTAEAPLTNIRITSMDAREFMTSLPSASLDRICVLYPDPWPKKKHHHRRIITADFLTQANALLKPEAHAELFIATDIPSYVMHVFTEIHTSKIFAPTAIQPTDWATPPKWWKATKYEAKAAREGRHPFYIQLKRPDDIPVLNHNLGTKA